jgi:hypothetical protein
MPLIGRLRARRDQIQEQLDRWIKRGFRGGGTGTSHDATQQETADKVAEVADLHQQIAAEKAKNREV